MLSARTLPRSRALCAAPARAGRHRRPARYPLPAARPAPPPALLGRIHRRPSPKRTEHRSPRPRLPPWSALGPSARLALPRCPAVAYPRTTGGGGSSGVQRIRPIGVLSAGSSRCTALAYELSTSISATETPLVGKCPESGRAPPSFCRRSNRLLSARDFVDSHDCAFSRPWRRAAELLIPTPEGPAWPQRRRRLPRRKMSASAPLPGRASRFSVSATSTPLSMTVSTPPPFSARGWPVTVSL